MLLVLLALAAAQQVDALPTFTMAADPRIQVIAYSADRVTPLSVADGYAAVVELGSDEHVENVVVGNSAGWEVTLNHAGDRLVVKPLAGASQTNMVVLSDLRRYVFLLQPGGGVDAGTFVLRFSYPAGKSVAVVSTRRVAEYRLRGDKTLFPISMGDDGSRTMVTWDKQSSLPAIFAVDEHGHEALVNARMVENDYVIEGVAHRYVLRLGSARATATRMPVKADRR